MAWTDDLTASILSWLEEKLYNQVGLGWVMEASTVNGRLVWIGIWASIWDLTYWSCCSISLKMKRFCADWGLKLSNAVSKVSATSGAGNCRSVRDCTVHTTYLKEKVSNKPDLKVPDKRSDYPHEYTEYRPSKLIYVESDIYLHHQQCRHTGGHELW